MHTAPITFKSRADSALADPTLKIAIGRTTGTAERKRAAALGDFPQFADARERGKRIKDHVIANLDHYLIEFEPTDRRQLVALDLPMSAPAGSFLSSDYGLYADLPSLSYDFVEVETGTELYIELVAIDYGGNEASVFAYVTAP